MCKLREAQQNAKFKEGALIEQELQGVREPWAKNLIQLYRLTSLEREQARLQGERGQLIAEAKGKIAEIELQVLQVDHEFSSEVANELRETDSKIGEYVERKVTAQDQLKRTDIRAPQAGVVFQSTANTVARIAADTTNDQRTGQSYYVVRISMTAEEIDRLRDSVKLTPGMPVEAFIQTGERTMLSYLVKPLHDQLMRSFREK
jgi:HlyD family secretion protein